MVQIAKFQFNPFGENTYLVYNDSKECIVIDPGCSNSKECAILGDYIDNNGLKPILVASTHGHIDHMCGLEYVIDRYKTPYALHGDDKPTLVHSFDFGPSMGFDIAKVPTVDIDLSQNDEINLGDDVIEVLHTPGHSPGGVCLFLRDDKILFTGDTLFKGTIGRTDLPNGDYNKLMSSIVTKLLPLGGDVRVFPGHGGDSTLAEEVQTNPFIVEVLENRVNPVYEN